MTETNATPAEGMEMQPVTVKLSKLTEGIGILFAGVLTMLESLDASSAQRLLDGLNKKAEAADPGQHEDNAEASGKKEEVDETGQREVEADGADEPEAEASTATVAPDSKSEEQAAAEAPKEETPAPSVTQDDITKIIVQKLKKDRSNNEKIGAILKAYGVAKVSELPTEKYEAFLTDLSQL